MSILTVTIFIHCIAFGEVIIFVAVINVTTIENNLVFLMVAWVKKKKMLRRKRNALELKRKVLLFSFVWQRKDRD